MPYEHFSMFKLVRDKVVEHCREQGCIVSVSALDPEQLANRLRNKIVEESREIQLAATRTEIVEELADLQTVLAAYMQVAGISQQEVDTAAAEKLTRKGGFQTGSYIESIKIPLGHKDIPTFMHQPDKYLYLGQVED